MKWEGNDRVMQMFLDAGKKTISAPSRTSARLLEGEGLREQAVRNAPGGGKLMFSTSASTLFRDCHSGLSPQAIYYLELNGGDDGARTRDLCRDSYAK
jgi:hypothetical protein